MSKNAIPTVKLNGTPKDKKFARVIDEAAELDVQIKELTAKLTGLKQSIDEIPAGKYQTPAGHTVTISETEKNFILSEYSEDEWRFEGIAYYAYEDGFEPAEAKPVYRFWSTERQSHFYTINEAKKDYIIENYPEDEWRFEGVAWYAFDEPS